MTDPGGTTYVENTIIGSWLTRTVATAIALPLADRTTSTAKIRAPRSRTTSAHNIDQDGSCDLTGATDFPNQDPDLAPIFDNGGGAQTEALLPAARPSAIPPARAARRWMPAGPPAPITAIATSARSRPCSHGRPRPSRSDRRTSRTRPLDLSATINLDGEAGGFHFVYGTAPGEFTRLARGRRGRGLVDTPETETLSGLNPGTTYYYDAVADNATASTLAPNVEQFTTEAGPPMHLERQRRLGHRHDRDDRLHGRPRGLRHALLRRVRAR